MRREICQVTGFPLRLGKDLMLVGMGTRMEIWDRARYLANEEATLAGPMPDGLANMVM